MTPERYAELHHPDCELLAVSYGGGVYLRRPASIPFGPWVYQRAPGDPFYVRPEQVAAASR